MRTRVVVIEGELLQVCEEVLSDVEDDALRYLHHYPLTDRHEDNAHNESYDQQDHECDQIFDVTVRDRVIERLLSDHGREESGTAGDRAHKHCEDHARKVFLNIFRGEQDVLHAEFFFKLLIDSEGVSFSHPSSPPYLRVAQSY